jgi:hypothetical protein
MRYVLLATALLLSSCGAQPPPPRSLSEVQQFIGLAERAVRLAQKVESHAPADDIQALTLQLTEAALATQLRTRNGENQGNSTTIRGMDVLASAEVVGCARAEATALAAISDKMPAWVRHRIATEAIHCAAVASEYLRAVRDQDIADDVGFAVITAYPIAVAAQVQAGLQTHALLDGFREASESIVTKLAPECHRAWLANLREWTLQTHYECVAYNGASARGTDRESVAAQATRSTSRGVATAVLAMLNTQKG